MRLRNVKNAKEKLEASPYYLKNPQDQKGNWQTLFKNENPLHLEIGTGKGQFLIQMAQTYPMINFLGLEKYESVLVRAIEKAEKNSLSNLKFICYDAKEITDILSQEIDTIYLNFSDPWPKNRHAKRRLTSPEFLSKYEQIFRKEPHILQKTDNIDLFAYSLETLSQNGYQFKKVSLDLATSEIPNIPTEYEEKFRKAGVKINYLDATKKG